MKTFYIIVTAGFIAAMSGRQSPINKGSFFGYAITKAGDYVISINTANDFPAALDSFAHTQPENSLEVKSFSISDFPASPQIENK